MIEVATFPRGILRRELIIGLVASALMHLFIGIAVLLFAMRMPEKEFSIPFYRVRLVDLPGLGGGVSVKASSGTKPLPSGIRKSQGIPVLPVKRLEYEEPSLPLKTYEPEALSSLTAREDIDKRLAKLFPREVVSKKPLARRDAGARGTRKIPAYAQGYSSREYDDEVGLAQKLYYSEVWNAIRRQWTLPPLLRNARLEAVVILLVRRDGRILKMEFEKRSGNEVFDDSVIRALRKANPLPPFPEIYSPKQIEIGVRFRPEQL